MKISSKILPIRLYGDEILREISTAVDNFNGELVDILKSTILSMKHGKGLGLAANQVGISKRFFAIDLSYFDVVKEPIIIVNPEIAEISGSMIGEEGCLSFPGLFQEIERPEKTIITGLDIDGKEIAVEGKGLMARVLLHEIDHLDGKMFIDHLSSFKRSMIKGKLKKIKAGEEI
ncbi:MAG: peptide deformylase [candidate division Zixibacteria bacterium]|nr:peptide deformylase [candidate division Zixibacteria bacterium]